MKNKKFVVVGATGCVGREMISILLEQPDVSINNITAVASEKSKGQSLNFKGDHIIVNGIDDIDFSDYDFAFFSAGSQVSSQYGKMAALKGCTVIDNTSFFRMDNDIPLIVPEINFNDIFNYSDFHLISNPNCSTIQMVMVLKPLHDLFSIKEVEVATYQSASGAGQKGINEMVAQIVSDDVPSIHFQRKLAFNVIPQIDSFTELLYTKEEMKMINETKKILNLPHIDVNATCVRVPVVRGHSEALTVKFEKPFDLQKAIGALTKFPGVHVSEGTEYVTAIEAAYKNDVFVSRIRQHPTKQDVMSCFVVSDNVRKGAALNAVQIAAKICELS